MKIPDTKILKKIVTATDEVIVDVSKDKSIDYGVNWADLHCVSAEWYFDDEGNTGYRVYIEEASPDAINFRNAVNDELFARGWDVEVITEW